MIVYELPPIDDWSSTCWSLLSKDSDADGWVWLPFMAEAFRAAAVWLDWEGDLLELPRATSLPSACGRHFLVIAWKPYDNRSTFLASHFRLPWLEAEGVRWVEVCNAQGIVHRFRAIRAVA
jgi:hypothetical protein